MSNNDIANYIISNNRTTNDRSVMINHIIFNIVLCIDVNNRFVPKWYLEKGINLLVSYLIQINILNKNQIEYRFSYNLPTEYTISQRLDYWGYELSLYSVNFIDLTLEQVTYISKLLSTPDIIENMRFGISSPYESKKNKELNTYTIFGTLKYKQ